MKKRKITPKYLDLDEKNNAIDNLEQVYSFICKTDTDYKAWKWVIITVDAALYGFSICACAGTNQLTVTSKKGYLISFNKALERCQDERWMGRLSFGKALVLSSSQKKSIDWIHKTFRNNFIHFPPKGWSIELHGMPHIVMDALDVIRFLAIKTKYVSLNSSQRRKVKSTVYQSKRLLKKNKLYKEFLILTP